MAPELAKLLNIPVFASLTSTSTLTFSSPLCAQSTCTRLQPDPYPYHGKYGIFSVGLGFYKIFCGLRTYENCAATAALTLYDNPNRDEINPQIDKKQFITRMQEFFCSNQTTTINHEACISIIKQNPLPKDANISLFRGAEPTCDQTECKVQVKCKGTCTVTGPHEIPSMNLIHEVELYIKGFELLQKSSEEDDRIFFPNKLKYVSYN